MAVPPVLDESGLQGWLNPRDFREIDIASQLLAVGRLEVELLNPISA
jgi:hypothetical protein